MVEEGKEYLFRIEKETTTPDNKNYWVLSGPGEKRFLIPSDYYNGYGFKAGTEITCRIDRINCSGQIFLEPRHPYYEEGKKYPFRVISHKYMTGESGTKTASLVVKDILGNLISFEWPLNREKPAVGSELTLQVGRIYKGKPVFFTKNKTSEFRGYRQGRYHEFRLLRVRKGPDGELYYIATDKNSAIHTIPVRYYEHYKLKPGDVFRGRIIKYSSNGNRVIEPKSPFYRPGTFIRLEVINTHFDKGENSFTLELRDKYGFVHFIQSAEKPGKEFLRGRVKRIRKGRPEIILL